MDSRKRLGIGFGLLALAAVAVIAFVQFGGKGGGVLGPSCTTPATVQGYYGGEKEQLLRDPEVQRILRDRYCIAVNARKVGSLEMVRDIPLTNSDDFLGRPAPSRWRSTRSAAASLPARTTSSTARWCSTRTPRSPTR